MQKHFLMRICLLMAMLAGTNLYPVQVTAGEIRVAVASNFSTTLKAIADQFHATTGHTIIISAGSTGKHYAQIINGAPFDVFLAADMERPTRLESNGQAILNSRFTYAIGELVLWSPQRDMVLDAGGILITGQFRYLSIANPELAPYGKAAREFLKALGAWDSLNDNIVMGENINQALHFAYSGNADLGLVAQSQLVSLGYPGTNWNVPGHLYAGIEQQAVLLRDSAEARDFMGFIQSEIALKIIEQAGYRRP